MLAVTAAGGLVGGMLLLRTPSTAFERALPWLLLAATLMLAGGAKIAPVLRSLAESRTAVLATQFALGVYGGYFGGAVGLMMMAAWRMLTGADVQKMQGARTMMVTAANAMAVATFIVAGAVAWWSAAALAVGSLLGGYLGAHVGRRLPPAAVKWGTVALCAAITTLFFIRAYARA
jgi:uncharacterized membrane protein YfcA